MKKNNTEISEKEERLYKNPSFLFSVLLVAFLDSVGIAMVVFEILYIFLPGLLVVWMAMVCFLISTIVMIFLIDNFEVELGKTAIIFDIIYMLNMAILAFLVLFGICMFLRPFLVFFNTLGNSNNT